MEKKKEVFKFFSLVESVDDQFLSGLDMHLWTVNVDDKIDIQRYLNVHHEVFVIDCVVRRHWHWIAWNYCHKRGIQRLNSSDQENHSLWYRSKSIRRICCNDEFSVLRMVWWPIDVEVLFYSSIWKEKKKKEISLQPWWSIEWGLSSDWVEHRRDVAASGIEKENGSDLVRLKFIEKFR